MKIKPYNVLRRLTKLRDSDKEAYMWLANIAHLNGVLLGVWISIILLLILEII